MQILNIYFQSALPIWTDFAASSIIDTFLHLAFDAQILKIILNVSHVQNPRIKKIARGQQSLTCSPWSLKSRWYDFMTTAVI